MPRSKHRKLPRSRRRAPQGAGRRCGLCGKTGKLTRTECCGNWICDDADEYVIFSYARNSCYRNHDRFTLCGYHHTEGHAGDWKECAVCREAFEPEMYAYYGTNEHNFEKIENPPAFEPKRCATCGAAIRLADGGYSQCGHDYSCESCSRNALDGVLKRGPQAKKTREPRPVTPLRGRRRGNPAKE